MATERYAATSHRPCYCTPRNVTLTTITKRFRTWNSVISSDVLRATMGTTQTFYRRPSLPDVTEKAERKAQYPPDNQVNRRTDRALIA